MHGEYLSSWIGWHKLLLYLAAWFTYTVIESWSQILDINILGSYKAQKAVLFRSVGSQNTYFITMLSWLRMAFALLLFMCDWICEKRSCTNNYKNYFRNTILIYLIFYSYISQECRATCMQFFTSLQSCKVFQWINSSMNS